VIEKKLQSKKLEYIEVSDVEIMKAKGFTNVPMLDVDGNIMDFSTANEWINSLEVLSGD
jgi:hypothetical protein